MDKKKLKFIFFSGIPFLAGYFFTIFTLVDSFENRSLVKGILALSILFLSIIGYVYFFDKTEKILTYLMKALCFFLFISSLSSCAFFLIFIIKPDFEPDQIPPRRLKHYDYDWSKFNIFSYITVIIVIGLTVMLILTGILIGNKLEKKTKEKHMLKQIVHIDGKENHQLVRIKSIRVISTAQPLMVNGRKIEKKDDSDILNRIIYFVYDD